MKKNKSSGLASQKDSRNSKSAESKTHNSPQIAVRITISKTDSNSNKSVKSDISIVKSDSREKSHSEATAKSNTKDSNQAALKAAIDSVIKGVHNMIDANEIAEYINKRNLYTSGTYIPLNFMKAGLRVPIVEFSDNPSRNEPTQEADSTKEQNIIPQQIVDSVIKSIINESAHFDCRGFGLPALECAAKPISLDEICAKIIDSGCYSGDRELLYQLVAKAVYVDILVRGLNFSIEKVALGRFQIRNSKPISVKLKQPFIPSGYSHQSAGTIKDAVLIVLDNADTPLHYKEICQRIIKAKLYAFNAIDPSKSVCNAIDRDIKTFGDKSVFVNVKPGWYKIRGTQSTKLGSDNQTNNVHQQGKLTLFEAVIIVMEAAGGPLSLVEITNRIIKSGLYTFKTSTPVKSVTAKICSHISAKGDKSEIVRVAKGVYQLRSLLTEEQKEKIEKAKPSEFKIIEKTKKVVKIVSK